MLSTVGRSQRRGASRVRGLPRMAGGQARWGVAIVLALLFASASGAQQQRYELAVRLKAFESAWESADSTGRERALVVLPSATTQFLSLRLAEAGRTLDRARFLLSQAGETPGDREWRDALSVQPESRLVDGTRREFSVTIDRLYEARGPRPANLEVRLWFVNDQVVTVRPEKFPTRIIVPLPTMGDFSELDRQLYVSIEAGKERVLRRLVVSQVQNLSGRLEAIRGEVKRWAALDTIEKATAHDRLEMLADLAEGSIPETDLPSGHLLANTEVMLKGEPFFTPGKAGEFWLSLPLGGQRTMPARLFVPKGLDEKKPTPLVIALHGAGGTENLFFEGYGSGCAVKACRDRGWMMLAPRLGLSFLSVPPIPKMLSAFRERFPVDAQRTFILGHSMGAALTCDLIQSQPELFQAAALLGGGGRLRKAQAIRCPVHVAVGSRDFALPSARRTAEALKAAGLNSVTFREHPGIEHMTIVRVACDDFFKLFETIHQK